MCAKHKRYIISMSVKNDETISKGYVRNRILSLRMFITKLFVFVSIASERSMAASAMNHVLFLFFIRISTALNMKIHKTY